MTSVDSAMVNSALEPSSRDISQPSELEGWLERLSDRLNPILVKEARQAMKSRHFSVTFSLLLICGWAWTVIGVVSQMPDIYYAPSGRFLLIGYYFVLAVPLLLVVPFSTYRSLASEREDGTFELLSISTLTSRQIVTGKLASAVLQMIVYYSALAPCIAFTYMLRGVDLLTVGLLLFYTFLVSLILCSIGLVFAGLSQSRHWQSLISVLLLLGLVINCIVWATIVGEMLDGVTTRNLPANSWQFWAFQLALITAGMSYIVLFVQVSAAQNSFASDNRSTPIRIAICAQTLLFIGWCSYFWFRQGEEAFLVFTLVLGGLHWLVYGMLMTGESGTYFPTDSFGARPGSVRRLLGTILRGVWAGETAHLSPRVRRQLPQSLLGRSFLTWFNPGSGTGYVFAVSHLALLTGAVLLAATLQELFAFPTPRYRTASFEKIVLLIMLIFGYFTAYLGVTRLLLLLIPDRARYGLLLPFLLHILVMLIGCAGPYLYQSWITDFGRFDFSIVQITNWLWALETAFDSTHIDPGIPVLVLFTGVIVLVANLFVVRREVQMAERIATPERVREDQEQSHRLLSFWLDRRCQI